MPNLEPARAGAEPVGEETPHPRERAIVSGVPLDHKVAWRDGR